ncbi:ribonuclease P protein component [Lolliginicoccus suaedae]|uniref:ribonuclease P protein component n=1 Tax=Lolliginicoccus suaedae TaxID=2605429 RepID=UPI0011EF812C|nr:ribonuclease P protein component [Lolliginicoccus suaedae]
MLPQRYRLRNSHDFSVVVRRGTKVKQRDLVLYVHPRESETTMVHGPRVGLIVSKSVGNAVGRHRVSRMLRHAFLFDTTNLDLDADVVIRALPSARSATTVALADQVGRGLRNARSRVGLR